MKILQRTCREDSPRTGRELVFFFLAVKVQKRMKDRFAERVHKVPKMGNQISKIVAIHIVPRRSALEHNLPPQEDQEPASLSSLIQWHHSAPSTSRVTVSTARDAGTPTRVPAVRSLSAPPTVRQPATTQPTLALTCNRLLLRSLCGRSQLPRRLIWGDEIPRTVTRRRVT